MATFEVALPAQSGGGSTSATIAGVFVPTHDGSGRGVVSVHLTTPTAVTGADTNSFTVNVRHMRANSSEGTIATFAATEGNDLAVGVPVELSLTAPFALTVGDLIDVQLVQEGTGLAVPAGVIATVVVA